MDYTWIRSCEKLAEYANIKVPEDLAKNIDRAISEHKDLGYSSRSEFVKDAIRKHLLMVKTTAHKGSHT